MPLTRNILFFSCLFHCAVALTGEPELRHLNYLAIQAQRGSEIQADLKSKAHGVQSSGERLQWRLVEPGGYVVDGGAVAVGSGQSLRTAVEWDDKCALEVNTGASLGQLKFQSATPHGYLSRRDSPLTTVRAWGPLYFYVPGGTRYFNIWIRASVTGEGLRYTIRDPNGDVALEEEGDFDDLTKVQILLAKGKGFDARPWSIEISRPTTAGLYLDDVTVGLGRHLPPYLALKPEWAEALARDGKYDPAAAPAKRQLQSTEAQVEPFHGLHNDRIRAAYDRDVSKGWKTTLPFTYILDYGARHVSNPQRMMTIDDLEKGPQLQGDPKYVARVGTAPPTLLHLGKDVALNHGWGPVKSLGGENVAYGRADYVTRLTPKQLDQRIATLRELTGELRQAGVRWVMPYICAMTINGNHDKRTGFWDFYDHWDEYRSLGLGPRPESDPFTWLQRNPDGSPRMYYRYSGDHYPSFDAPNHRYAASWHAQGFRGWMREVVRFLAKCDFDGCFVDNGTSQRGIGPLALDEFKQYLQDEFGAENAQRLLGIDDIEAVAFPSKAGTPLFAEMNRFWCATIREQMAFIKRVGTEELGREFAVFPNGGRPAYIQRALTDTDFVMFEKSHGEYGSHPGLALVPVFDELKLRAYNDNIFEYKFVQSLRQRVKPLVLSRPGYPVRKPWAMLNENAARLALAECAAFSGGGGFLLRPNFTVYHDVLNSYRRFFETHPSLYAGLDSYATLGVLAWPEQEWYGNATHLPAVRQVTDVFTEARLLFDYVPESQTTLEMLSRYEAVVAADTSHVSDEQMATLTEYVKGGGKLITIGEFASHKPTLQERSPESLGGLSARIECQGVEELVKALGTSPPIAAADSLEQRHVKINAFAKDQRIVVHVVNYNVPLGVDPLPPTEMKDIEVEIPLRSGMRCSKAVGYAPDDPEPVQLAVRNLSGKALLTLPALRVYQVVELTVDE